jgi:hypothetical protein
MFNDMVSRKAIYIYKLPLLLLVKYIFHDHCSIIGMHRTRVQTGKPGFGHSRYLNARLSYSYTLVHIRRQSEPGMTKPEFPGMTETGEVRSRCMPTRYLTLKNCQYISLRLFFVRYI